MNYWEKGNRKKPKTSIPHPIDFLFILKIKTKEQPARLNGASRVFKCKEL